MSNLTSWDWWLATYCLAAGVAFAFYVGQLVVKLLLIKFASHKRIDDGLWRLGTWWKLATGNLRRTKPLLSKRNDSLPPSQEHLVVEWP